jgi:hypothetical protein
MKSSNQPPSASRPAESRVGKPFEIAVRLILRKSDPCWRDARFLVVSDA